MPGLVIVDKTKGVGIDMAQPEKSGARQSSRQRRTRQPGVGEVLARFWSKWRVEVFVGLVMALAIFLLVERLQIRLSASLLIDAHHIYMPVVLRTR